MNWEKINKFRRLMRLSLRKTIFLNFSMLPFKQAIKLPIICTRYTYFYSMPGRIVLTEPAHFGMIRLGFCDEDMITPKTTRTLLQIEGKCVMGARVRLGNGVVLRIEPGATLTLGNEVSIGTKAKVICYDSISIGRQTQVTCECQLIDTNFHYMIKDDGTVVEPNKEITIGAHCWIGNRSSIMKGTVLPDYTTVASNSLCNKRYDIPQRSIIAGMPAKLVKSGVRRCWFDEEDEIKSLKTRQLAMGGVTD